MSFILDALKKSESERQRQSGPTIFEVKVAPPRNRLPRWVVLLAALMLVNLGVVGWVLMRGSSKTEPAPPARLAAETSPAPALSVTPPAAPVSPPPAALPGPAVPAVGQPDAASAEDNEEAPLEEEEDPAGLASQSDDYEPAIDEPRRPAAPRASSSGVIRATASGLPTYQDAAAAPGANLPELRLDLHVYAMTPEQRFVFLNMQKLQEGDSMSQGVRVENITPDGVVLEYQGKRFVILRD